MSNPAIPEKQFAIQLVGPDKVVLNSSKDVSKPGPYQILVEIEAVGLCFSDLKLLKQFSEHPRKSEIVSGIDLNILKDIPSYAPGNLPIVPGHEAVCRIIAAGEKVKHHNVGERCLVQTDYRDVRTKTSNAAFGYNFEGGLQEYTILDERIIMDPKTGERFMIPVSEKQSASAVCLVEPWACVEDSYVNPERKTIKPNGKILIIVEADHQPKGLSKIITGDFQKIVSNVSADALGLSGITIETQTDLAKLPKDAFDDIIYFGAKKETIEFLNDCLAANGLINIVTSGEKIGSMVSVGVGRVHYGMTRWIGTTGSDASESYCHIPSTGELRPGEKILVVGAGGPMGQMHVIRNVCSGIKNLSLVGTDFDDARLKSLEEKAMPFAKTNNVSLQLINTNKTPINSRFSYFAIMAPVGALVADAVKNSAENALINIFAGIPAPTKQEIDLDLYIANHCYMFGTSGSVIRDMKIVLEKIESGSLDTNLSVDAVCGMAGAAEGLKAVENRTLAGKIIVYPKLHNLGLIPLSSMKEKFPSVAKKLKNGNWTKEAEEELLDIL
jgi:D-arabinose 1-dehydrogenase-like Zn-dependent alcohol dehydrogenase